MTTKTNSDSIPKLYFQIREVSNQLDVAPSTVRYYCREFGIEPFKGRDGRMRFTSRQLMRLAWIRRQIVEEGRKLGKIKELLTRWE